MSVADKIAGSGFGWRGGILVERRAALCHIGDVRLVAGFEFIIMHHV
jgi:hypothetical protein